MTTFNRFKNFRNSRMVRDVEDNWILKSTLWILFLGLLTGLITIAIINIKPYALLLASVSTQTAWVFAIPLLGPLFQNLSVGASTIGAILIWAPVQILECLWILIALDAKAQKAALRESIALTEELAPHRDDRNADTRRAVKRVSRIPFFFIKWAAVLALAAYTFDLIVGLKTYPIWKDWQSFGFWLKSMNPIWLNLDNARDLGIMLFSFEAMLILVVIVGQWLFYRETEET
jgi:hypothetical protein